MAVKKPLVLTAGQIEELRSGDEINLDASDVTTGTMATARLGSGTANNTTFLRGDQTWATPTGGVTGFTGSQNSASPNNTVNASRLLVDATSTNADFVLQPKGTGAVLAQLPDNTTTGGNKRGANALDLQTQRSANTQVASGLSSCAIGKNNTASGESSVCIGLSNTSSSQESVSLGSSNLSQGLRSLSLGYLNTASSSYAIVLGNQCTAEATYALSTGFESRARRSAQYTHASNKFANRGDCQYERYTLMLATTNATSAVLTIFGDAPTSTNRIEIQADTTYVFRALVVARRTDANDESAAYEVTGIIDRNVGANTTAFVGTPTVTIIGEDTAAWDVVATADTTNGGLDFTVTGESGKTIRWAAVVELMKVQG